MPVTVDPLLCFNPTLVRLRQGNREDDDGQNTEFQSHAGSIEAGIQELERVNEAGVSIPRWFD